MSKKTLLILGLGYVAENWLDDFDQSWDIIATKRIAASHPGIKILECNDESFDPALPDIIKNADAILLSAPPDKKDEKDEKGDPFFHHFKNIFAECPKLRWLGYLSATSVYGDHQGEWVNEESATNPTSPNGQNRLRAEQQWQSLWQQHQIPIHIFRLSGIYGPGRSALEKLQQGNAQRIRKTGHLFSRIHVDDICQILTASLRNPTPGAIYNLADDEPSSSEDVITFAAALLGIDPPDSTPYDKANLSPMAASFYRDNKKVSNQKIKKDLNIMLHYPSFREGLMACYETLNTK